MCVYVWALQVVFNLTKCPVACGAARPKTRRNKGDHLPSFALAGVVVVVVPTGPTRLDLFHRTHHDALEWGRQNVRVEFR